MNENIVLCGFMGSGKTVTGTLLAELLNLEFVDLDLYIEKNQNTSVADIFATLGEDHFRRLETEAAVALGKGSGRVIACGGGTVLKKENLKALKENGRIFYLQVSADRVIERLKNDSTRPLLANKGPAAVAELLAAREPLYLAAADHVIDSDKSPEYAARQILKIIK